MPNQIQPFCIGYTVVHYIASAQSNSVFLHRILHNRKHRPNTWSELNRTFSVLANPAGDDLGVVCGRSFNLGMRWVLFEGDISISA